MRFALALLLMLEGFSSGMRLAQFVPVLVVYSWLTVVLLVVRGGVGILQFASGWILLQDRPFGRRLGRTVLLLSGMLTTFEIGFRLVPTSLFPSYRWQFVGMYWLYVTVGVWVLRQRQDWVLDERGADLSGPPDRRG